MNPDFPVKGIAMKLPPQVSPVARANFPAAPRLHPGSASVVAATSCLLPDHWCYWSGSRNYACCGNDSLGNPLGCFTNSAHACECLPTSPASGQTAARGQAYP
jgi:hypothetical protein